MRRIVAGGLTVLIVVLYLGKSIASGDAAGAALFVLPNLLSNAAATLMLSLSMLRRPRRVEDGWGMLAVSFVAANLFVVLSLAGVRLFSDTPYAPLQAIAASGTIALVPVYLLAVFTLGRSLTLLPEANVLKTRGIYGISRHPLYAIYMVWYGLQVLLCQSAVILVLAVVQAILQVVRARHEERLLEAEFPEYEAYRARVGWFGPRAARRPNVPAEVPAA